MVSRNAIASPRYEFHALLPISCRQIGSSAPVYSLTFSMSPVSSALHPLAIGPLMTDKDSQREFMTPEEFQEWLKDEIRDSAKAHELRVQNATAFVTAYAEGKLTPEEAQDKLLAYDRRWGEALYGASVVPGLSDEAILQQIDAARDDDLKRYRSTSVSQRGLEPRER